MSMTKTIGIKIAALLALVVIGVFGAAPDARADSNWGISLYGGDPYYGGGYAITYRDYDDDYYYGRPYYRSRYYAPVRYRPVYRPAYRAYYYDSPRRYYRHHRYYDRPYRRYRRW